MQKDDSGIVYEMVDKVFAISESQPLVMLLTGGVRMRLVPGHHSQTLMKFNEIRAWSDPVGHREPEGRVNKQLTRSYKI